MTFISDLFGGGGDLPAPTKVLPPATRIEPGEVKPKKKRRGTLATQMLNEPLIKEEKLGT